MKNFNNNNKNTRKNKGKSMTKIFNMDSQKLRCPPSPPQIKTIQVFHAVIRVPVTLVAGVGTVTQTTLGSLSGGAPYVFRLKSIMFHGNSFSDGQYLNVAIPNTTAEDNAGDNDTFNDHGTLGQSQPGIHIRPPFLFRQQWNSSSGTNNLATITSNNTTGTVTVTAYIEVKLPSSPSY